MPVWVEPLARRILRASVSGQPDGEAMLSAIGRRLNLADDDAIVAAVHHAVERGWVEEVEDHSIRLTHTGRRLIQERRAAERGAWCRDRAKTRYRWVSQNARCKQSERLDLKPVGEC